MCNYTQRYFKIPSWQPVKIIALKGSVELAATIDIRQMPSWNIVQIWTNFGVKMGWCEQSKLTRLTASPHSNNALFFQSRGHPKNYQSIEGEIDVTAEEFKKSSIKLQSGRDLFKAKA